MKHLVSIKQCLAVSITLLLTLITPVVVGSAPAKAPQGALPVNIPSAPFQEHGPGDPAELEAFLNTLFAQEMEANHIVGAAVAVVKDGRLFFSKGYGYANLEQGIPVDPERTLFKVGSVTKVFTWTAVMQLVERGVLNLDADVNTYLDFRIPETYPQPITLRHLMAHTAGFEDRHVDMVAWKEADLMPPHEWLVSHIPARVYPPGEVASYSNYGAALAGYIVARASGETYSQYIQTQILDPLDMRSSTAFWPAPPELRARESEGYMYEASDLKVFPPIYGQADLFPAGILRATVADMAHFMIAQLQGGRYSNIDMPEVRILQEATVQQMHTTLYAPDPRLLGTTYGFFEFNDNGQRVIGHSGEGEPMHSLLLLLPDQNMGIFVAYNSWDAGDLTNQHLGFQRAFFDHYYPVTAPEPIQPPTDFSKRADQLVGAYRWTRSASTTLEKYSTQLVGPTVEVTNPGDGTLLMATPYGDMRLIEVEPLYFRQVDGPFHFVFRENAEGRITYMFTDMIPQFAFEKAMWYETLGFNMPLLLISLLMFVSMLPVAAIRMIRNHSKPSAEYSTSRGASIAYLLIGGICILNVLFVVGTFIWGQQIVFGIPLVYKIVMGLGVLSAILTASTLGSCVLAWKSRYWGTAFRVYYTLVVFAALAFVWFLNFWNLLGWRF